MTRSRGLLVALGTAAAVVLALVIGLAAGSGNGNVSQATPTPPVVSPSIRPGATSPPTSLPTPTRASPSPIPLPSTAQISAPPAGPVWVLVGGSRLFVSADSGTTWQERGVPAVDAPNLQISFVDAQRGWAMSPGSETSCATQAPLRLWQTVDGAMSWTALAPSGIPSNRCREALSFVNAMTGWLSTSSPNEPASILQTTDGGRTWRSIALSDAPGSTPRPLHAGRVLSISTAMFVDAVAGDGSAARRYVYAFQSNGQGFDYIAAVPNATDAFAIAFDRGSGVARWLLIAPGATSQESRDTGQTWRAFTTDYQQAAPIAPVITFADASVGYATVRGSIQRTTDGGAHWAKIDTPGTR